MLTTIGPIGADRSEAYIHLLEADPDLAIDLERDAAERAAGQVIARTTVVQPGPLPDRWGPEEEAGWIGLLLVDGLLLRELEIAGTFSAELLGPGDIVRPHDLELERLLPLRSSVAWSALTATRMALLEPRVVSAVAEWPEVTARLFGRAIGRSRALALGDAITNLTRVADRLLVLLWYLAQRWGKVTGEGVVVSLPLTHEILAKLTGARRPSVTTALGELGERALVTRRPDRSWLLCGDLAGEIDQLLNARADP